MNKKILSRIGLLFFSLIFVVVTFQSALAQPSGNSNADGSTPCNGDTCLQNPLGAIDTPTKLIGKVLNSVFGIVGSLALVMFVYGGLTWMTSSGNQEKIQKGRDILVWSAIGLFVIFSSYALVRVVLTTIVT